MSPGFFTGVAQGSEEELSLGWHLCFFVAGALLYLLLLFFFLLLLLLFLFSQYVNYMGQTLYGGFGVTVDVLWKSCSMNIFNIRRFLQVYFAAGFAKKSMWLNSPGAVLGSISIDAQVPH